MGSKKDNYEQMKREFFDCAAKVKEENRGRSIEEVTTMVDRFTDHCLETEKGISAILLFAEIMLDDAKSYVQKKLSLQYRKREFKRLCKDPKTVEFRGMLREVLLEKAA